MTGRSVDWCITALTEDVLDHYQYKDLRKEKGFVDNKKMQDCVVESILKARAIPDDDIYDVMMEHLVIEFNQTLGHIRRMKADIQFGGVHPMAGTPVFHPVVDGEGFKLGRRKDFLKRPWNLVSRRLQVRHLYATPDQNPKLSP